MPYTVGSGYTDLEIKCYPLLSAGPTIASGTAVWAFGSWVEIVPANTIGVDFSLLAVTSFIAPTRAPDVYLEGLLEVGIGAPGAETTIIQIPFAFFIDSAAGHCMEQVIPLMPPRKIPANSRVALRIADDTSTAYTYGGCKIRYIEGLDTYTDELIKSYPSTATGVTASSSATTWGWGSWYQLAPANAITVDFDICAVEFLFPQTGFTKDVRYQGVIQIGIGEAASEAVIISLPVTFLADTFADHIPEKLIYTLPIPRRVPANTRVAVRVANDGAVLLIWGPIKIRYIAPIGPAERSVTESLGTVSDAVSIAIIRAVPISEPSISVSDSPATVIVKPVSVNEPAVSVSDAVAYVLQRAVSISEPSIPVSDAVELVLRRVRDVSEPSIPVEDAVERGLFKSVEVSEPAISVSDVPSYLVQRSRVIDEPIIPVSDAIEVLLRRVRDVSEPVISVSDAVERGLFITREVSEPAIGVSDLVSYLLQRLREISEPSIPVSDVISYILQRDRLISEPAISVSDSTAREIIHTTLVIERTVIEDLGLVTDEVTVETIKAPVPKRFRPYVFWDTRV